MKDNLKNSIENILSELQNISQMKNIRLSEMYEAQETYGFSDRLMMEIFLPGDKKKEIHSCRS